MKLPGNGTAFVETDGQDCVTLGSMRLRFPTIGRPATRFLEAGPLVDRELELVEPAMRWIEPVVESTASIGISPNPGRWMTRDELLVFVQRNPRGREPGGEHGRVPAYVFWMRLRPECRPPVPMAGSISLRISNSPETVMYFGHVGYGVYPAARGHHYAERATRLLFPLALRHGLDPLWITCNPDNAPSYRTCQRLGGEMVEIVDIPEHNIMYQRGERQKCRFRFDLSRLISKQPELR